MPFARGQTKPAGSGRKKQPEAPKLEIVYRLVSWLQPYERNPRKNDKAVDRMVASIREFGFAVPVLARSNGEVVDGHLRLKAAIKLNFKEVPVILCDNWTSAQVKAFRLMVNRSVNWADWDLDALSLEFGELKALEFDLTLTGFDSREIDQFTLSVNPAEDDVPPVPEVPVTKPGDLWLLGPHRLLCGDATKLEDVAVALNGMQPRLMVTDPPYGIELDAEWRDKAGLNIHGPAEPSYMKRKTRYKNADMSFDIRADWSEAFALVPTIEVAYVWHASSFTSDVLRGLLSIGFLHSQQIIWRKPMATRTRTHYWYQHEPCWYVRKKNAPWIGAGGTANSTIWDAVPPKFIFGGSDEEKFDHPTQKPVALYRKAIENHMASGALVYDPFAGSGTCIAAAELISRVCIALEIEPRYADVIVTRWQNLTGKEATLEGDGRTFAELKAERLTPVVAA